MRYNHIFFVREHKLELFIVDNEVLFFEKEKRLIPTLRLLHKCKCVFCQYKKKLKKDPYILPKMQIDKGGLKFIFGGANVMAPGLTSAGILTKKKK
jgi:PUA domain protein